jgi:hypothetical protein
MQSPRNWMAPPFFLRAELNGHDPSGNKVFVPAGFELIAEEENEAGDEGVKVEFSALC